MNELQQGFANAELSRRLNSLFLNGSIKSIDTEKELVSVEVTAASGSLTCTDMPLLNRHISNVSVGNPILLISPQGSIEAGVVFAIGEDPELKRLREQVDQLQKQLNTHNHY
ncbi:hypothetical protein EOL70_13455 [Leucothrix sargassi]|nr:hypothetical protein EOL70_13455 [Leucothrix sargassi]